MKAVEIDFSFGRTPDRRAVLRRFHAPWPRHVVIGDDFLEWAGGSAWCERAPDGAVWFRPTDAAPAFYRSVHRDLDGSWHYDLVAVGNPPRLV